MNVFDQITNQASVALTICSIKENIDDVKFNLFVLAVITFALKAHSDPLFRKEIGIKDFSWLWSALALLYSIYALLSILLASDLEIPLTVALGEEIARLSGLLMIAGIVSGTFNVLGLKNKWQVFGAAFICYITGIVLSNV